MKLNMTITSKGVLLTLLFLVIAAGLVFLGLKAYGEPDCTEQMRAAYAGGLNDGLTRLIQEIQESGVAVIGMPNNQSFEVTHPSLCGAILQARMEE